MDWTPTLLYPRSTFADRTLCDLLLHIISPFFYRNSVLTYIYLYLATIDETNRDDRQVADKVGQPKCTHLHLLSTISIVDIVHGESCTKLIHANKYYENAS